MSHYRTQFTQLILPRLTEEYSTNTLFFSTKRIGVTSVTNFTTERNTLFFYQHRDRRARTSKPSSASTAHQPIPDLIFTRWNAENPSSIYCVSKTSTKLLLIYITGNITLLNTSSWSIKLHKHHSGPDWYYYLCVAICPFIWIGISNCLSEHTHGWSVSCEFSFGTKYYHYIVYAIHILVHCLILWWRGQICYKKGATWPLDHSTAAFTSREGVIG